MAKQTKHDRRSAAKEADKADKVAERLLKFYLDAHASAVTMLEELRRFANEDPDFVYEKLVLLVTPRDIAVGLAADIAERFKDEVRREEFLREEFQLIKELKGLNGLTAPEVAIRFLREEDKMADHLATVSATLAALKKGVLGEQAVVLIEKHASAVFDLLGLRKLNS